MTLRPYQQSEIEAVLTWLASAEPGSRKLKSLPTGGGKTHLQDALLAELSSRGVVAVLLCPSLSVAIGALRRMAARNTHARSAVAAYDAGKTESAVWRHAELAGIFTPTRLANRIAKGAIDARTVSVVILDEAHWGTGSEAVAYGALRAQLTSARWVGYTATPYRGSVQQTLDLHTEWGEPVEIASLASMVEGGYITVPSARTISLDGTDGIVDDAGLSVSAAGGEFTSAALDGFAADATPALAQWIRGNWREGAIDRPTLVVVPSDAAREALVTALEGLDVRADAIGAKTPAADRVAMIERCRQRQSVIVDCGVLSRMGWDAPWLGRMIDSSPTMSPVSFMQRIGRLTRRPAPGSADEIARGEGAPEYVTVTRNLERHAYLWDGVWPSRAIAEQAQREFRGAAVGRSGAVARHLAEVQRYRPSSVKLTSGGEAVVYSLRCDDLRDREYNQLAVLVLPGAAEPVVAARYCDWRAKQYGRWRELPLAEARPLLARSWASAPADRELTDKQMAWWNRDAHNRGIAEPEPNARQWSILPVLADLGLDLRAAQPQPEQPQPQPQPEQPQPEQQQPEQPQPEQQQPEQPQQPDIHPADTMLDGGKVALSDLRDTYPCRERLRELGGRWTDGRWTVPIGAYLAAVQAAPMRIIVAGDTYPHRERLRKLGGRWEPEAKRWLVPESAEAHALAAACASTIPCDTPARRWLRSAVLAINAACDGVTSQDGVGWSLATAGTGRSLARTPEWTGQQWRLARQVVQVHRRQAERLAGPAPVEVFGQ